MIIDKMFEYATRNKVRFQYKGLISVEDLWDLKVTDLDIIYGQLSSEAKELKQDSLLSTKTEKDKLLSIKIEIVKYIFSVKMAEKTAKFEEKYKAEERQKIMSALKAKKEESLYGLTEEELEAKLKELD